jgi:sulfonate transport system substrate-binding protein
MLKNFLKTNKQTKKYFGSFLLSLGLTFLLATVNSHLNLASADSAKVVRIGHLKFDPFTLVKARGDLDKTLQAKGIKIEWREFQSGPPLIEAMNAEKLDIGRVADVPPVIAQAADAPIVYIGGGATKENSHGIVVHTDSPIKTLADLKGKKVAFAKSTSANYFIVKALNSVNLEYKDIKPTFLPPADARLAFENKQVDAWVTWDPFFAEVEAQPNVRVLTTGKGLANNRDFFIASKKFASENPGIIKTIEQETQKVATWANQNPQEVVKTMAPILKVEPSVMETSTKRRGYEFEPMNPEMIAEQQEIADTFLKLKLIPKAIKVQDIVFKQ